METLQEYQKLRDLRRYVWLLLPRSIGFWIGYWAFYHYWKTKDYYVDDSALIGLGVTSTIWIVAHIIIRSFGPIVVELNMWEWGCGCCSGIISHEMLQYLALAFTCWQLVAASILTVVGGVAAAISMILVWFLLATLEAQLLKTIE